MLNYFAQKQGSDLRLKSPKCYQESAKRTIPSKDDKKYWDNQTTNLNEIKRTEKIIANVIERLSHFSIENPTLPSSLFIVF